MEIARIPYPKSYQDARHQPRPVGVIVHAMGEYIEGDEEAMHAREFLKAHGLSAHMLVTPSGVVIECLRDGVRGAHARGFNDHLGIEFLVPGVHTYGSFRRAIKTDYLTPEQLSAGMAVVGKWMYIHGFTITEVKRHSDVSPGRKIDPGAGFPWDHFQRECIEEVIVLKREASA